MVYAIGSGGGLSTGNAPDTNIVGMYCFGAGNFNIYFNSIYLANTTSNYNFYTTCLYFTNPPATINVENNILKNTYTGTGIKSYCVVYNVGTVSTIRIIITMIVLQQPPYSLPEPAPASCQPLRIVQRWQIYREQLGLMLIHTNLQPILPT